MPAVGAKEFIETCRRVEAAGFDVLSLPDHIPSFFGPLTGAMAAAGATERIHIATRVLANDFRHPVVLTKELATLDLFSGGRLEIGIGAGWMAEDYQKAGIQLDAPSLRIGRLAEAVKIMKGLMADGPFSFEGAHYNVGALEGIPKPIQRPHPPILIGGGRRRILSLAGREADIVHVNLDLSHGHNVHHMSEGVTPAALETKISWVREAAGERFESLELVVHQFEIERTDNRMATAERLASKWNVTAEVALQAPYFLFGNVGQMCEDLLRRRERFGVSMFTAGAANLKALEPVVERLSGR